MPWKVCKPMVERLKFIARLLDGEKMAVACRDFGISYPKVDRILYYLIRGFRPEEIVARGFTAQEVELVRKRLDSTHWKRRLPTVAVMSQTAIGEFYLRPVDY